MLQRGERLGRDLTIIVGIAVALVGLAIILFNEFGSVGLTALNVVVSGILTTALVLLYSQQTGILDSQRELLTQELNREYRQQHSETLRKRVAIWHGNPEREEPVEPFMESDINLPQILAASFQPAPSTGWFAFEEEEHFQVVPSQLQGDRYLQDLLENHAPELQEAKVEIEELHEKFIDLRSGFRDDFEAAIVREGPEYTLEPADWFFQWIFEHLVMLERGLKDDMDDVRETMLVELDRGSTGHHPDEPVLWIRIENPGGTSYAVYSAKWDMASREEIQRQRETVEEEATEVIKKVLDRVEEQRPYTKTVEAAETLDSAADATDKLEKLLIEYHGRPIYPGQCHYLEETQI